jgi:inorganic pyrophosphatase
LTKLNKLDPKANKGLIAVIETPRGSRHKFDYDPKIGAFCLSKTLPAGTVFPFDFGFIPRTLAPDGDPLDVVVVMEDPTFTGCVLDVRLVGVIEAEQIEGKKKSRNDRLIAVSTGSHRFGTAIDLAHVGNELLEEITEFFVSYNKQQGRSFIPKGRHGVKRAQALFRQAHRTYMRKQRG